ncbi:plasminogen-binding N-terminal domain-containing protein [Campylobacter troglodytis]|uniref:plasminogen-binding N-terminal domain-containing protein n=1 Tax=Campylobacter troglodytis TaxID=654363 RepID=UPI00115B1C5F|nr:plasminogen-binding N-terminal domain-containing protein [Campylobacter troglodytis]TQR61088.1 exporting protein [Campylobacter troglodytis]
MLKKLIFFALLCVSLQGFEFKSLHFKIEDIKGKFIYIQDDERIKIGTSAAVLQSFKNTSSIISSATVIQREDGLIKLELSPFTILEQKALPLLDSKVQKGDEVIVNFLYDRILLIAPNEENYNSIREKFNQLYFVHPDLLGAYMIREFKLSPKQKDFKLFCASNAVGVLAFVLEDKISFLDCASFTVLFEEPFNSLNLEAQKPFYSNVEGYKKNFFNFFEWGVKDYYEYYKKLIGEGR